GGLGLRRVGGQQCVQPVLSLLRREGVQRGIGGSWGLAGASAISSLARSAHDDGAQVRHSGQLAGSKSRNAWPRKSLIETPAIITRFPLEADTKAHDALAHTPRAEAPPATGSPHRLLRSCRPPGPMQRAATPRAMKSSWRKGVRFISHLLIALGGRFAGLDARCRRQL